MPCREKNLKLGSENCCPSIRNAWQRSVSRGAGSRGGMGRGWAFYDAFYVNLALVKRDHGEDMQRHLQLWELSLQPLGAARAARLVASGWSLKNRGISEEPDVSHAPEEAQESCPRFQNGERKIFLKFPQTATWAWKWGEALSLFLILWRPLLWTTSSTGSMARW